jgi:uncharacterized protein YndB with AHSA1/START domain
VEARGRHSLLLANPLDLGVERRSEMDEGLDPILIQVTIPLPVPMIYAALSDPAKAIGWLCDEARIRAEVGGDYRLRWSTSPAFESPGAVTQLTPDVDLGFTWFAPPQFGGLMNGPPARTSVYVRLQESPEGVDVTLEHAGWGTGGAWEEARSWHFHFWEDRLVRLKDYLIREAYG